MTTRQRAAMGAAIFALLAAPCTESRADDAPQPPALALFAEGRRLMAAGDYKAACPKLAESKRLAPGVGTTLNLALCYESLGKTASAWSQYEEAARAAHEKGQTEREEATRARAARLLPALFHITITVAAQPDGSTIDVTLDGQAVPPTLWGMPTPVDPGRHEIRASGQGKALWDFAIAIEKERDSTVQVPVLASTSESVTAAPELLSPSLRPRIALRDQRRWMQPVGIAAAALGVVSAGVGTAFAFAAANEKDSAGESCKPQGCLSRGQSELARAGTDADIATVLIPLGIAAIGGGGILWLLAPQAASKAETGLVVAPSVGPRAATLTAHGAF